MFRQTINKILKIPTNPIPYLTRNVLEANTFAELMKAYGFTKQPLLARDDINEFEYMEDLNKRRIRDAEVLAVVVANGAKSAVLEIGTSDGMGTSLIAANAPNAKIYTINIPPEEIISGEGGVNTTIAIEKEKIGIEYRKRGFKNIEQIYANTATWVPDIQPVQVAFIDGCHDADFVYNDTKKVLQLMKKGDFIIWHDFNLELMPKYGWINDVCLGVEMLYADGSITGRILHVRDSWMGVYRVE
jgi:hypothetical protein